MAMEQQNNQSSTRNDLVSAEAKEEARRAKLLEQARREVPALRAQVAEGRAALRRIAES